MVLGSLQLNYQTLSYSQKRIIMAKFGIEIIDPSGKAPIRAFIGEDDALWDWMAFESVDPALVEVQITVPEGYRIKEGAVVRKTPYERICSVPTTDFVYVDKLNVTKVNMVAKGLKEVSREDFRKKSVPDSRIVAVIPI